MKVAITVKKVGRHALQFLAMVIIIIALGGLAIVIGSSLDPQTVSQSLDKVWLLGTLLRILIVFIALEVWLPYFKRRTLDQAEKRSDELLARIEGSTLDGDDEMTIARESQAINNKVALIEKVDSKEKPLWTTAIVIEIAIQLMYWLSN